MKTKIIACILITAMLITLSACSDDTANGGGSTTPQATDNPETPASEPETPETPEIFDGDEVDPNLAGDFVVDVEGVKFDLAEAAYLDDVFGEDGGDLTPETALQKHNNNEYYNATWDYAVFQPSMGVGFNSIDNPDFVDKETYEVSVELPENTNAPVKIKVGDELNGLTVTLVDFGYTRFSPSGWGDFLFHTYLEFDGYTTLGGYLGAAVSEDAFYIQPGDIFFYPDPDFAEVLPFSINLFNMPLDDEFQWFGDFFVYTDIPRIRLGTLNSDDYSSDLVALIPADGSMKHVQLKLTDLTVNYKSNTGLRLEARIEEIN
ncbi:MAG: hypothetical protein FWH20_04370 [Oscillospiraceae bacterium]|nr:hypothetical protein [Oscillospiraceae bacterium]